MPLVSLNNEFTRCMRKQSLTTPSSTTLKPISSTSKKRLAGILGVQGNLRIAFMQ